MNGLTVNELAAEKILGWCGKALVKHILDLAYIARALHEQVDKNRVAELVEAKFRDEAGAFRYRSAGIRSTRDVASTFLGDSKREFLHGDWRRFASEELFLLPGEEGRSDDGSLTTSENIERLAREFWQETLDLLAG